MSQPGTKNFPTALDDAVSLVEAANNASGLLSANILAGDSTLTLVSGGAAFANTGILWCENEAIGYATKSGNVFSGLTRGMEITVPVGHAAGALVEQDITALSHTVQNQAIIAVETKLGWGADTPVPGDFMRAHASSAGVSQWSPLTSQDVQNAMGYVPVNKAGDTMTGGLTVPSLHTTGAETIDGNLAVAGNGSVHDLSVGGALTVAGASQVNALNVLGMLTAKGAAFTTRTITAGYTIQPDDFVLFVNPSVAHVNLQFPSAAGNLGRMLVTKRGPYLAPWRWQLIAWSAEVLEFGPTIGYVAFRYYDVDWGGHWWVSDGIRWRIISFL